MPDNSNEYPFPTLKRIAQITSSYCGPAVLEMLLSFLNYGAHQHQIVQAANIQHKVNINGSTIAELALATKSLFPELQFWYKHEATLSELSKIVNQFQYPVGVEWQGVFDWPDEDEEEYNSFSPDEEEDYGEYDDDEGHYSIVTYINTQQNLVLIADPERHYAGTDRNFSILQFEKRWWDQNIITDPKTGHRQSINDFHTMFIITPKDITFPLSLNMIPA